MSHRPDPTQPSRPIAKLAAVLVALALTGCSKRSPAPGSAAAADDGSSRSIRAPSVPSAGSGEARQEPVTDPTLNMVAATFHVPAKWHFQGTLMQGGACVEHPFSVLRATSPDGLSFFEQLPIFGWIWGTGPAAQVKHDGCLPLKQALSAQDFLKYLSATLNVEYVADESVPAELAAKAQRDIAAVWTAPGQSKTRELARATVRFRNGSFVMKGRLATQVDCTETHWKGMRSILRGMPNQPDWTSRSCNAGVRFIAAPEESYQATVDMLDAIDIGPQVSQEWAQTWTNRRVRQINQATQRMSREAAAQRQASAHQFAHDQAVRQQMHQQFLATMQRGTDMSMRRAAQVANSNHRMAQDMVDYALDRQTVRDPRTGQISKTSSSYNYTWVDSSGKTSFQTNDANANPNGSLQGNWTRQQVVHGDGSP